MNVTKYNTLLNGTKLELVKEKTVRYSADKLDNPDVIVECMNHVFNLNKRSEEYLYLLAFNSKLRLQGVFEVSHGTVNMSVADPAQIYKRALLCNATSIVLVHNHPSGDPTPSNADYDMTDRCKRAGEMIGINLLDHIIVGSGEGLSYYHSIAQRW